jgi:hypothetical protein
VLIYHDLESSPFEIKTDSKLESDDQMKVSFLTSQNNMLGGPYLIFSSVMKYRIYYCTSFYEPLPKQPPSTIDKVWRFTLTRSFTKTRNSVIRLFIHCNSVEVLNLLLSDTTCSYSKWSEFWTKGPVTRIRHYSGDNASDYYRPGTYNLFSVRTIIVIS